MAISLEAEGISEPFTPPPIEIYEIELPEITEVSGLLDFGAPSTLIG